MSHREQLAFLELVTRWNPSIVDGADVLEIGSYDVNGSIRRLFHAARRYVGVDLVQGPGVDRVGYGHEVHDADGTFDVVVSSECFEHDPHWEQTFRNMVRLTRPGGLVVFTCASRGRPEHGTTRSERRDSPGTQSAGLDYYRNLSASDFATLELDAWFSHHRFWYMPTTFDLYFVGVRLGGLGGTLPDDVAVARIRTLLPLSHRLVRVPLRLAVRVTGTEERYQALIRPYWNGLVRAGRRFHRSQRTV